MAVADEFVWMVHPDVGIPWQCPVGAVGAWTARGWELCDPPTEADVTKSDGPAAAAPPEQVFVPDDEPDDESMSAADTAADTEEGAE